MGYIEKEPQINQESEQNLIEPEPESIEMEPQMNADERRLNALSEEIIGAAFEINKSHKQSKLLYEAYMVLKAC